MSKKLTPEILRTWNPCEEGYKFFCKAMPKGATLEKACEVLRKNGKEAWVEWLFVKARNNHFDDSFTCKGYMNSGDSNSGNRNSGNWNSGDSNSGNWNSGNWNSGDRNSGNWNSGNRNSGFFNTETPDEILVFGKHCNRQLWEEAYKPRFLFFDLTIFVTQEEMSKEEKEQNPHYETTGGYLKTLSYKEAFKKAWDNADKADRIRVKELPNFDKYKFFEISGIDVDEE